MSTSEIEQRLLHIENSVRVAEMTLARIEAFLHRWASGLRITLVPSHLINSGQDVAQYGEYPIITTAVGTPTWVPPETPTIATVPSR